MAESNHASGIGFSGLLTIVFVIAKIFGKISWSWWWVFSPLWIGAAFVFAIIFFIMFIAILAKMLE